jgi:hypothetical protein
VAAGARDNQPVPELRHSERRSIVILSAETKGNSPRVAYVIGLLMYSRSLFVAPAICNVYHVLACQSHLAAADKLQGRTFRINQRNVSAADALIVIHSLTAAPTSQKYKEPTYSECADLGALQCSPILTLLLRSNWREALKGDEAGYQHFSNHRHNRREQIAL